MPTTNYHWDPVDDVVMYETDENGDVTVEYTHEPGLHGELISQRREGKTSYHHYDGQGNTVALTDENENVTDTYKYNAFGETIAHTGTTLNPYRFSGSSGYYFDEETEDCYIRAREYSPRIARWLSKDPSWFDGGDANLYRYVGNSPTNAIDPTGRYLIVTSGQRSVVENFFGKNNVMFETHNGGYRVVLGPGALPHLLVDYSNRPGTNRDYIIALAHMAESGQGMTLTAFNVQFTKNVVEEAKANPAEPYILDHPTMGRVVVKEGSIDFANPIPMDPLSQAFVTYLGFNLCVAKHVFIHEAIIIPTEHTLKWITPWQAGKSFIGKLVWPVTIASIGLAIYDCWHEIPPEIRCHIKLPPVNSASLGGIFLD